MTAQLFLFDTAALIDGLQLAFELSAATGETVGIEDESYTPAQVDAAIAALDALPEKQEEVYTGAQVGAAIARLKMLPDKRQAPQPESTASKRQLLDKLCWLQSISDIKGELARAGIKTDLRTTAGVDRAIAFVQAREDAYRRLA